MTAVFSHPEGFGLARLALRTTQDVVSLSRRTRTAGLEFGLQPRTVRNLSAVTFEIGRALTARGAGEAELRLSDGPSLQVVFRFPCADAAEREALGAAASEAVTALRSMVDQAQLAGDPSHVVLSVRSLLPPGAAERLRALAGDRDAAVSPEPLEPAPADVQERAYREMQLELQEANRGVIAMHRELESNADKLTQAEDRLQLLLDSVQDYAICMITPGGEIASWNSGAERLFGYSADEIIGRDYGCFYPAAERDLGAPAEHLRFAEEGGKYACECLRVRRGGAAFDAHITITPVRRARELQGFSLVVRDITERKRLEDDLRRRAEDLAAANRAKEDFLATLSHELRTPLNAMLGWTRLLRMGRLDGAAMSRALETIERNAHIQEQLIADILDLSRIVTGKLRMDPRPLELAPVVEAALDAVRPAADAKNIHLFAETTFEGAVLGDPDRLQQVVWNLLANAIKFTPAGGRVTVTVKRQGPSAVITVADTGEGIAPELLPFIFDRFRQGDGSVTKPHGGLGLGLSIVRHIIELHGGRVQAQSDGQGQGSTFSVHLPVRAVRQAVESADVPLASLNGVKVLVVDDDADARETVSLLLAQCGARTAAVGSAREALQLLADFRPDVLVSDIGMPGEDGFSLIRRVRAGNAAGIQDVPAVALTAYSEPEHQRRALTAGFQRFVPKPVEPGALAAVVRSLAERRH